MEQKKHYTLVLKGMIALSNARFPHSTRGSQLDILARRPLLNEGLMYFHGTGHGIGHYLCVHEGPQSIRMEENSVTLVPGMVLSNEPAVYLPDNYGIRIENVILVEEIQTKYFGQMLGFETLTLVPIEVSCVLKELLSAMDIKWINNYNAHVCNTISPYLDIETANWLKERFKAI